VVPCGIRAPAGGNTGRGFFHAGAFSVMRCQLPLDVVLLRRRAFSRPDEKSIGMNTIDSINVIFWIEARSKKQECGH